VNYFSIDDLISAGITNANVLFDGDADNGNYSTDIPEWVKFNGTASGKLYYDANSWIGFVNNNTLQICYNHRDTVIRKAYLEVGTVYGNIGFVRFRFNGHNYGSSTRYEWEVFLFETGDIMLHAISVISTKGSFYIQGSKKYTYTAPTLDEPYVTFYSTDENNSTFSVEYDIINLVKLHYLVEDADNVIYTVQDNALVPITDTDLTADVFKAKGFLSTDDYSIISQIPNAKVYAWTDSPISTSNWVRVHAVPFNQVIYSDNLQRPQVGTYVTVLGIENVTVEYEGLPLIAVSFDGGTTWRAYKNQQWVHLEQDFSGNTPFEIESISTPAWNSQFDATRQIKFRFTLTEGDSITNLIIHYINPAE
jgi:hypothetical protein